MVVKWRRLLSDTLQASHGESFAHSDPSGQWLLRTGLVEGEDAVKTEPAHPAWWGGGGALALGLACLLFYNPITPHI